jgi:hypothetical protein
VVESELDSLALRVEHRNACGWLGFGIALCRFVHLPISHGAHWEAIHKQTRSCTAEGAKRMAESESESE